MPVGGVSELQAEHLGILLGLLHPVGGGFVSGLGLDDREGEIPAETEEVIDPLGRFAQKTLTDGHDATVRDRALLCDGVRFRVPTRRLQLRNHLLPTSICL